MRSAALARLAALNFGIQFVWGAVLALSLQARSVALAGTEGLHAYATIAAVGAAVGAVVQVTAGPLSDRLRARTGGRAAFFAGGVAVAVPALVWFYLAPNFGQLLAAFVVLEIALNVASGPYSAVIPDYVPSERRGAASSFLGAFQSFGNAAGLVLVVVLGAHDLVVAIVLALGLAGSAAVTALFTRTLHPLAASPAVAAPGAAATRSGSRLTLRGPLGTLLLSRGAINLGFYTLLGFLLFFIRDALGTGRDATTQTGLVFLTFTILAVVGSIAAARPSDRYDKRTVVGVTIGTVAVALAILASATSLAVVYPAAALAGFAWGAFVTADWALAAVVLPPGAMATAMGVWNIATAVPQIIAPILTTPLVDRVDALRPGTGTRAAIVLAIVEFVIGAILVRRLPPA